MPVNYVFVVGNTAQHTGSCLPEDLARLPLLTKTQVREHFNEVVDHRFENEGLPRCEPMPPPTLPTRSDVMPS